MSQRPSKALLFFILLDLAIPAHLATLDPAGFPRITPIWFLWEDGSFYMSGGEEKRHVQPDIEERWAHKLILKYITGQAGVLRAQQGSLLLSSRCVQNAF